MARAFSSSYLARETIAHRFIPVDFRSPQDRLARVRAAAARSVDPEVVAVLREQQARLSASPARAAGVDALARGGAAVVATGQQVGLFLGPLYGLYKAASAVSVARALARETGVPCVPLFWLQTEDHDFPEIAGATIAGPDGRPVRLSLEPGREAEARVSIAHRRLGPEIARLLDALADLLPPGPAADETLSLLRAHYVEGRGFAAAFAGVLAALFADDGLLVLDPRDVRLARLAAPIYAKAIRDCDAIAAGLEARRVALAEAGFDEQIPTRARCALVFFHQTAAEGPRFRLERPSGGDAAGPTAAWRLSGGDDSLDDATIAGALARDPLRFSTSALLRPIVQDTLLPVAAYVGGPAEVSYFAQLGPLYDHYGLALPLVVPRARFRCLDARTRRLLDELHLTPADLARPDAALADRQTVARPAGAPDPAALARRITDEIAPAVDAIAAAVESFAPADRNLARAAARTRAHVGRALERLTGRYTRLLAERDGVVLGRLARLRDALAPGGVPQERAYAWPSLAGRHGPLALKRLVLDGLDGDAVFSTDEKELRP